MVKCVFCGREEESFRGVHRINNDGSISYFCSGKCRKNALNLGRDKRKVRWTEAYRITRTKAQEKEAGAKSAGKLSNKKEAK